ncbi:MAG TPA: hypothetical protein VKM93_09345 [Terriglobia bacterium]|nr:hypothetical protein [Terriglobia bacterium]
MINAVSNATQTQAVAVPTTVTPKTPAPKPQAIAADTVTLTNAAQTAAQEAAETPAQTRIEAGKGDAQAQRLLSKEALAKAAYEKHQ